jgi:hypothetical protein
MALSRVANALRHPSIIPNYLKQRRRLWAIRFRQRGNGGVFAIHFARGSGFFAHVTWCAYILSYCHDRRLIPHITSGNPKYIDPERGPDFLAYFFEIPGQEVARARAIESATIRKIEEIGLPTSCIADLTLERAAMLVARYMPIRAEILEEVDRFAAEHFVSGSVLGVHYRGTDKYQEAPPVARERCRDAIRAYLSEHPEVERIFAASDEASFIRFIEEEFRSLPVVSCDDRRSESDVPLHHLDLGRGNYDKGRQALVNCLLLARCDALIRTASSLSAWASVFNPKLPVVLLNQPYARNLWFPENRVVRRATLLNGAELAQNGAELARDVARSRT